ncbi:hypothetical protein, partial [Anaerotignum lactatifermentans]|uniref:hypothetical protein n=1 Tax=Anaerotignum lactatifermentans TaxID=160404 RepID=UPI003AB525D5
MLFDMIINAGTNNENSEKSFMRNVKTPIQYHLEKGLVFLLVNPIKTPGYAGGISELQLQAKTSYAIIILSPPRHKKA